jgi:cobyric acid synthase
MRNVAILELPFRGRSEFSALLNKPGLRTERVKPYDFARVFPDGAQLIIIPGSARTTADLEYLRGTGGETLIRRHLAQGNVVMGICGGYQMLGQRLADPYFTQGRDRFVDGMGMLPIWTVFGPKLMSCRTRARLCSTGEQVAGVEHRSGASFVVGRGVSNLLTIEQRVATTVAGKTGRHIRLPKPQYVRASHWLEVPWSPGREQVDGLFTNDRKVWGSYLHLIFDNPKFVALLFSHLGLGC